MALARADEWADILREPKDAVSADAEVRLRVGTGGLPGVVLLEALACTGPRPRGKDSLRGRPLPGTGDEVAAGELE